MQARARGMNPDAVAIVSRDRGGTIHQNEAIAAGIVTTSLWIHEPASNTQAVPALADTSKPATMTDNTIVFPGS